MVMYAVLVVHACNGDVMMMQYMTWLWSLTLQHGISEVTIEGTPELRIINVVCNINNLMFTYTVHVGLGCEKNTLGYAPSKIVRLLVIW